MEATLITSSLYWGITMNPGHTAQIQISRDAISEGACLVLCSDRRKQFLSIDVTQRVNDQTS